MRHEFNAAIVMAGQGTAESLLRPFISHSAQHGELNSDLGYQGTYRESLKGSSQVV